MKQRKRDGGSPSKERFLRAAGRFSALLPGAVLLAAAGCQNPMTNIAPEEIPVGHDGLVVFQAPGVRPGYAYGAEAAMDGEFLVVGAPYADTETNESGGVYVYRRSGESWELGQTLTGAIRFNGFGSVFAISGDTIVVGDEEYGSKSDFWDIDNTDAGNVHVYRRTGPNAWEDETQLSPMFATNYETMQFPEDHKALEAHAYRRFGSSVAVEGDTIVVGAEDSWQSGSAFVFERTGENNWNRTAWLVPPNGSDSDKFGSAVAIAGDIIAVGAASSNGGGYRSGSVYLYRRTAPGTWTFQTELSAPDGHQGADFGAELDISGGTLIVGAPYDREMGFSAGAAYIYERTGTDLWNGGTKLTAFDATDADLFGSSVAIDGDSVVIGAKYGDTAVAKSGAAYLFTRNGDGLWLAGPKLFSPNQQNRGSFGIAAEVHQGRVLIGASGEGGWNEGAAYLFDAASWADSPSAGGTP